MPLLTCFAAMDDLNIVRQPDGLLNSEVVFAMGELISSTLQCIVMPPWTYQCLVQDNKASSRPRKKANRQGSRYPPGTSAFAVVATARSGVHWVVLGVMPEQQQLVYYDSMSPERESAPDERKMRSWLELLESRHGNIVAAQAISWPWWPHVGLPKQHDGSSCGIFALCFVQCMASGKHGQHTYSHARIPELRLQLARALKARGLIKL